MFAFATNLCYTVTDVKNRASKRGYRDRFLVSIPLGAFMYTYRLPLSLAASGPQQEGIGTANQLGTEAGGVRRRPPPVVQRETKWIMCDN
jgi:hypothetical protein